MELGEFVTKAMSDADFMLEVFKQIPDDMLSKDGSVPIGEEERGQMGRVFGRYCWPGAQAMGCTFTADELAAECDRQYNALRGFRKARFGVRAFKMLGMAKPALSK